jgi:hypothetical protein
MLVCGYTDNPYQEKYAMHCWNPVETMTSQLNISIMVGGEYTYGLSRFLLDGAVGHGIQPIRYRMLKSRDSFNLSRANLLDSYNQNISLGISFKLL